MPTTRAKSTHLVATVIAVLLTTSSIASSAAEVWIGRVKNDKGATWPHIVFSPEGRTCSEYWDAHAPNAKKLATKVSGQIPITTLGSGPNTLCDVPLPPSPVQLFGILNAVNAQSLVFDTLDDWDARIGRLAAMLDKDWSTDWGKMCGGGANDFLALYEELQSKGMLDRCTRLAVGGSKAGLGRMDETTFVTFANEMHASGHKQSLAFVQNWFDKTVLPQLVYCAIGSHARDPNAVKSLRARFPQLWQNDEYIGGDPQIKAPLAGVIQTNFETNRVMLQLGAAWVRTKVETEKDFESVKRGAIEFGGPSMAQYVLNAMALALIDKALFATDDGSVAKTLGGADSDWTAKELPVVKCLPVLAMPREDS
jgi:hypothetical protein